MGWLSDAWDGISGIADTVEGLFGGGSSDGVPSDFVDTAASDLPDGGGDTSLTSSGEAFNGDFSTGGSFAKSAIGAVGSAALSTVGSSGTNPIPAVKASGTYNRVPLDNNGAPGKAQRAPTADPASIYAQWNARLSSFMGPRN